MPHLLLYFLALACLSTASSWAKLNQMPVEVLGFWRLALAAAILITYQIFFKKQKLIQNAKNMRWIIASGFFFFLHLWTYKYAAKHTLVSLMMILFATNPIWTAIFNIYAFKEKITARMWVSFLIAFFGIYILVQDQLKFSQENNLGNFSALITAVFYAIYLITGKKARMNISNLNFASLQYSVCALFFGLACLFANSNPVASYSQISWISVLGLVFIPTLLGHFLFTQVMSHMNLAVMTCGKLIEPVLATILAYFLFQEKITSTTLIAFVFTSIAILNLFWPELRSKLSLKI